MSSANRRAEFFALEATEYLAELEPLAARTEPPDLERLVRGARALRGAALMAGLGTFARAAAGLESIAKHVREHALGWEPHARPAWREGLQTLRGLVARATVWEAADDRHALALAERLERAASGQASEPPPPKPQPHIPQAEKGPALSPGVRAFIARESELIASSLLEASRALAPMAPNTALSGVLDRLRSLRGVGSAGELSPLPELLDAMEATTRSVLDNPEPPEGVAAVFADAADALAAMARSVAQDGHVTVPVGLDHVAERLLESFAAESTPALASGATAVAASGNAEPVPIELVGVGDHLQLQAEALGRYTSPAARALRLFVLHRTLSTMPARGGTGSFIAPVAAALTRVIASGDAAAAPDRFVTQLRESGEFLVSAASNRDAATRLAERDRVVAQITGEPVATESVIAIEALAPDEPLVSIDSLAPDESVISIDALAPVDDVVSIDALAPDDDVTSIDSLAPDDDVVSIDALAPDDDVISIDALAPDDDVVSIDALAPDDDVIPIEALAPMQQVAELTASGRLEAAYRRRSALRRAAGGSGPSLDALLGERMVAIELLLYRGDAALARAEEVRGELTRLLSEPSLSLDRLRPLLDELLDLVPLARDAA